MKFYSRLAIQQEKGKQQLISGIENFDPAKLKHAETLEKNPLPTKEGSYILNLWICICWDRTSFTEGNIISAIDAEKIAA